MRGPPIAANHFCEQYRYSNYWRNIKTLAANSRNRVMQNLTRNIKLNMQKTMIIICQQCVKMNTFSLSFHILFSPFFPIIPQDSSKSVFGDGQKWGWNPQYFLVFYYLDYVHLSVLILNLVFFSFLSMNTRIIILLSCDKISYFLSG